MSAQSVLSPSGAITTDVYVPVGVEPVAYTSYIIVGPTPAIGLTSRPDGS